MFPRLSGWPVASVRIVECGSHLFALSPRSERLEQATFKGGGGGRREKVAKKKTVPVPWNPKLTLPRPLKPSEYKLNRFDIFPSQNKPHQNGVWKNKPTPKFLKTLRFQLMIRYLNFKRFILGRDSRTNQSKGIIFVNLSSGPRIISENESVVLFLLFKTKVKGNDVLTNLETGWLGTKNCSSTNCANL